MILKIGYFYPQLLNLYGDNGNIEILKFRAEHRGFLVEIVNLDHTINSTDLKNLNLNFIFMGGGPDSAQNSLYQDFLTKKEFLSDYVLSKGVGLFVCGGYQLLGEYYKDQSGVLLKGLNIFDLYTEHFGKDKPRCIGNVVVSPNQELLSDDCVGSTLVGFENHGGRTYLGSSANPFAIVKSGFGNNGEDLTEGVILNNTFGTYLHGPILSKNPRFADYLIAKSLKLHLEELAPLNDALIHRAHKNLLK